MKIKFLAVSALIGFVTFTSCDSKRSMPNTKVTLNNTQDSIAYGYGVGTTQQVEGFLMQQGLLKDTAMIAREYNAKIASADVTQAATLTKEKAQKIDEALKNNKETISSIVAGLAEGLKVEEKDIPYYMGLDMGQKMNQNLGQFEKYFFQDTISKTNKAALVAGFANAFGDDTLQKEFSGYLQRKDGEVRVVKTAEEAAFAEQNLKEGTEFLAENSKKEGVVTLENGIQYKVNKSGNPNGKKPIDVSNVNVDYRGRLTNNIQFDASKGANISLGQVIPGWQYIIPMMTEGDSWTVFIPSELGYGEVGGGEVIPPNSVLVFDITLNSVN